ncbi:MAG: hypothetical protein QOG95_3038, partial [Mycobacterium sp.]|nr:hypothetical protein [Mycobacterium sp.]
ARPLTNVSATRGGDIGRLSRSAAYITSDHRIQPPYRFQRWRHLSRMKQRIGRDSQTAAPSNAVGVVG